MADDLEVLRRQMIEAKRAVDNAIGEETRLFDEWQGNPNDPTAFSRYDAQQNLSKQLVRDFELAQDRYLNAKRK